MRELGIMYAGSFTRHTDLLGPILGRGEEGVPLLPSANCLGEADHEERVACLCGAGGSGVGGLGVWGGG